ncbi:Gfo/Idh/MocA family protein [Mucilaginibacter calamicampi]|uniref:Gfo/Idh/MocA family protein n=1 Tax=Mucilaginibacter calamicampi TaxID=1302352 RepID=A0ABW2YYG4_9SPHI
MLKVALIGAGKMGISHLSILGAHPKVKVVGVCDTSKLVVDVLEKYSPFSCFANYKTMLSATKPDAVFVAAPTKYHAEIVKELLQQNIHVFVEKPFCLTPEEGAPLVELAEKNNLVNQVGYHNKFGGTWQEVKRLLEQGAIGDILHFKGESYGPVVVKKQSYTWRSDPGEGGGCLMEYASHVIDLINYIVGPITQVNSSILKSIFSRKVEDAVYALVKLQNSVTGTISVNWSDETYRVMSTSITIEGTKGKIVSDINELKVYLKDKTTPEGYTTGWNIKYVTDLTEKIDFYLRGEEYSAQIDYFINAVIANKPNIINTFESAWLTDRAIDLIRINAK